MENVELLELGLLTLRVPSLPFKCAPFKFSKTLHQSLNFRLFSITNDLAPPYLSNLISVHSALYLTRSNHIGLNSVPQMCQGQLLFLFSKRLFFWLFIWLNVYNFSGLILNVTSQRRYYDHTAGRRCTDCHMWQHQQPLLGHQLNCKIKP